jgi:hypothetical protein
MATSYGNNSLPEHDRQRVAVVGSHASSERQQPIETGKYYCKFAVLCLGAPDVGGFGFSVDTLGMASA